MLQLHSQHWNHPNLLTQCAGRYNLNTKNPFPLSKLLGTCSKKVECIWDSSASGCTHEALEFTMKVSETSDWGSATGVNGESLQLHGVTGSVNCAPIDEICSIRCQSFGLNFFGNKWLLRFLLTDASELQVLLGEWRHSSTK